MSAFEANPRRVGLLMALIAPVVLAFNSTFAKFAYAAGLDPTTFTMLRLVVAALALWVVFLGLWREQIAITRPALAGCALIAASNTIAQLSYYWGLTRLDASIGTLILYVYPAVVIVLLRLRGEPFTPRRLLRLVVALAGVGLLLNPFGARIDLVGTTLVLVAAVTYALHLVLGQVVIGNVAPRTVALYVVSLMAFMATGTRLLVGGSPLPLSWAGWWPVLGIALLGTVVSRLALFTAIKHVGSTQLSLIGVIEPMVTILVTRVFLGEMLSPLQWVGGLLILGSLLLIARSRQVPLPAPYPD